MAKNGKGRGTKMAKIAKIAQDEIWKCSSWTWLDDIWLVAQFHSKQLSTEMSLNSLLNHFSKSYKSLKINAASYRFSFEFLRQLRTHSQSPKLMMKMFWCWKVSFYHYCCVWVLLLFTQLVTLYFYKSFGSFQCRQFSTIHFSI